MPHLKHGKEDGRPSEDVSLPPRVIPNGDTYTYYTTALRHKTPITVTGAAPQYRDLLEVRWALLTNLLMRCSSMGSINRGLLVSK